MSSSSQKLVRLKKIVTLTIFYIFPFVFFAFRFTFCTFTFSLNRLLSTILMSLFSNNSGPFPEHKTWLKAHRGKSESKEPGDDKKKVFIRIITSFISTFLGLHFVLWSRFHFFVKDLWVMFIQARPSNKNY